jgi:hypothetical protein
MNTWVEFLVLGTDQVLVKLSNLPSLGGPAENLDLLALFFSHYRRSSTSHEQGA